jgi:hypothetical protein
LAIVTSVAAPAVGLAPAPLVAARMVVRPPAFTVPRFCRTTPAFPMVCRKPLFTVIAVLLETRVFAPEAPELWSSRNSPPSLTLMPEVLMMEPTAPLMLMIPPVSAGCDAKSGLRIVVAPE